MHARGGARHRLGVFAVALALVAGTGGTGCGRGAGGPTPTAAAPGIGLSGPGTPLAAGLVAPPGTVLVGPVFTTARAAGPRSMLAVLRVDGDPLAAWDELADQARALRIPLAHSGACQWSGRQVAAVGDPRPAGADALRCDASAVGRRASVRVELWSWATGAEMTVTVQRGEPPSPGALADPGPAPAAASAQVPELDPEPIPATGAPFGQEANCFEAGYRQFRVPPGATVVGGGTTPMMVGFVAVLAVRDAHRVLRDLGHQAIPTGAGTDGGSRVRIDRVAAGGRPAWHMSAVAGAGGGSCEAWANPEGNAIVLTAHND